MIIKRKEDAKRFLGRYMDLFEWDGSSKYYFAVKDTKREGSITLIKYPENGPFTVYRKNNKFWDLKENEINKDDLIKFVWGNRKEINKILRDNP